MTGLLRDHRQFWYIDSLQRIQASTQRGVGEANTLKPHTYSQLAVVRFWVLHAKMIKGMYHSKEANEICSPVGVQIYATDYIRLKAVKFGASKCTTLVINRFLERFSQVTWPFGYEYI